MGGSGGSGFAVDFGAGRTATAARVSDPGGLRDALRALGLGEPRPVVVVVGGAGGMTGADAGRLTSVVAESLLPAVSASGAAIIDGATDAGIIRVLGQARAATGGFPLIGVAAEGTIALPGAGRARTAAASLEPHHSHFLLVPGADWGDEAVWLARAATLLAGGRPSLTVLVNGGQISFVDVAQSLAAGRRVLVLDGSGRAADLIAAARHGDRSDGRANTIADSPEVDIASLFDPAAIRRRLAAALLPR